MSGRVLLLTVVVCGWAIVVAGFALLGYEATWRLWGVPTMTPHFADLRAILGGLESLRMGHDPLIENPQDPWSRPMNYPRIWLALALCGLDQSDTTRLGILLIFLFFAGALILGGEIDRTMAGVLGLSLFSPALMFAYERANSDLVVFFCLCIALFALRGNSILGLLAIVSAGVLKLFPFLGLCVFLHRGRGTSASRLLAGLAGAVVYIAATYKDVLKIRAGTPQETQLCYGVDVAWMAVHTRLPGSQLAETVMLLSYAGVLSVLVVAFVLSRSSITGMDPLDGKHIDSFLMGSGIYIGTFVLTNNWDYRLMFLLLTIPSLTLWSQKGAPLTRWFSRGTLLAVLMALSSISLRSQLSVLPFGVPVWFLIDQFSKWSVFFGLVCLSACFVTDHFVGVRARPSLTAAATSPTNSRLSKVR